MKLRLLAGIAAALDLTKHKFIVVDPADTDKLKASHLFDAVPKNAIPETPNYIFYMAADDVPRRMTYSGGGAEFIMNLTKVGEPVVIVAPDKSEQIDQSILKNREKTA